jgi:hypothetical protein
MRLKIKTATFKLALRINHHLVWLLILLLLK